MKEFRWFSRYEEVQGLDSWNQFLKISNYLKTCSTSFPGAECLTLHPEFCSGCGRSAAAAAQGSVSAEANGKCPCCCSASGKCSWQVPTYSWHILMEIIWLFYHPSSVPLRPRHCITQKGWRQTVFIFRFLSLSFKLDQLLATKRVMSCQHHSHLVPW